MSCIIVLFVSITFGSMFVLSINCSFSSLRSVAVFSLFILVVLLALVSASASASVPFRFPVKVSVCVSSPGGVLVALAAGYIIGCGVLYPVLGGR